MMSFEGSAGLMNVAGEDSTEVKREGKLKLPEKRRYSGPVVGFQRALITS